MLPKSPRKPTVIADVRKKAFNYRPNTSVETNALQLELEY